MKTPLFSFITSFPKLIETGTDASILGRAQKKGLFQIELFDPITLVQGDPHRLDDSPYGGGAGELLRVDVMAQSIKQILAQGVLKNNFERSKQRVLLLDPGGKLFVQADAKRLISDYNHFIFVAGRYEGIDARIEHYVDEVFSLGDFILSNGDVAALALFDAMARHIAGVLGNEESLKRESHSEGRLEASQYTRPFSFEGHEVPDFLLLGHHQKIAQKRRIESYLKTNKLRPDLLEKVPPTEEELSYAQDIPEAQYPWLRRT